MKQKLEISSWKNFDAYVDIAHAALFFKGGLDLHEEVSSISLAVVTHIRDHLLIKLFFFGIILKMKPGKQVNRHGRREGGATFLKDYESLFQNSKGSTEQGTLMNIQLH